MTGGRIIAALSVVLLLVLHAGHAGSQQDELPITGKANPDLASFDRMMISFIRDRDLPGASLAVGRNGKVVYARGFGHADREKKLPVGPNALFRIASLSKPITGVAILQLIEKGKLRLNNRVFALLGLRAPAKGFDPRWKKVTIHHLLEHRGGWDRDQSFDPMFRSPTIVKELGIQPPALPGAIIRYMLARPLDFDPGTREAYSNFGYCLLGRVIEKVSGQSYEAHVRQNLLAPLRIKRMRLGKTLSAAPDEVTYHAVGKGRAVMGPALGQLVPRPYGCWCLEAMDAHGGWIASAPALVRFAMSFDNPAHCPILKPASIRMLFAPPAGEADKDVWYAKGWMVRPDQCDGKPNTWHTGSLDGTSTLLVRRCDGLSWAVLFNTSQKASIGAIDRLIHKAANAVKTWP